MAERLPERELEIGRLRIRVPGLSEAEARDLGREVARRLALAYAAGEYRGEPQAFGAVRLRLELPASTPRERLADLAASRIVALILGSPARGSGSWPG
jgi:hypothetical protein